MDKKSLDKFRRAFYDLKISNNISYKYLISYVVTGNRNNFGYVTLESKNKIDSFDEVNSVIEFIKGNYPSNVQIDIKNIILLNE